MRSKTRAPTLPIALAAALSWLAPAVVAAQAAPQAINPCTLLTAKEVSAVLGQSVEPGRLTDNGLTRDGAYSTTCLWAVALPPGVKSNPKKPLGGQTFAILNIANWPGGSSDARKYLDSFRTAFEENEIDSKPVVVQVGADEALWWGDGVAARKDGVSFGVSVGSDESRDERKPKSESLARLIIPRLPKAPA